MSCNKMNWLGATDTVVGNVSNSFASAVDDLTGNRHVLPYFAKLGNIVSMYNIVNYARQGNQPEMEQATASFVGGMVMGRVGTAIGTALVGGATGLTLSGLVVPIAVGLVFGTVASIGID